MDKIGVAVFKQFPGNSAQNICKTYWIKGRILLKTVLIDSIISLQPPLLGML